METFQERHTGSKISRQNIYDILEMTVNQAIEFFTEYNQKNDSEKS